MVCAYVNILGRELDNINLDQNFDMTVGHAPGWIFTLLILIAMRLLRHFVTRQDVFDGLKDELNGDLGSGLG